jgi:tRNA dimethylallyltransferase
VKPVVIVGPTASGKSRLAMDLAESVSGEIVSTDSMAVYRGMDIGTAKPSIVEQQRIRHHLIDVWEPSDDVSVAEFQVLARECIADIVARGVIPIIVGGSGLYVSAVFDDLDFPGTDPHLRSQLEAQAELRGSVGMHERLAQVDPVAASAIDPRNIRRVIRALEVVILTGEPFHATLPRDRHVIDAVRLGLRIDRETLDQRITQRVDAMWAAGFVEEVRALPGIRESKTASRALGYSQVLRALDGHISMDEARQQTIEATSKFARRQQRWFEKDSRIHWIPYDTDASDVLSLLM